MPQNVGLQKLCPEVSNYAHFSIWGIKKPTWQPCSQAHSKLRLGTSQARLETPGSCVKPTSPIFVAEGKEQKCNQPVPPDIAQLRENGASGFWHPISRILKVPSRIAQKAKNMAHFEHCQISLHKNVHF